MSRDNPTVFQTQDRVPGVPSRHALGLWLPTRKLASSAYVPGRRARMGLFGRQPYWFNFGFPNATFEPMQPDSNQDDRVTSVVDLIVLGFMGSAVDQVTGVVNFDFAVQFFDSGAQEGWQIALSDAGNATGTAQNPFVLRRPHFLKAGSPIIATFQNSHPTNPNLPQVSLFGVLGS